MMVAPGRSISCKRGYGSNPVQLKNEKVSKASGFGMHSARVVGSRLKYVATRSLRSLAAITIVDIIPRLKIKLLNGEDD